MRTLLLLATLAWLLAPAAEPADDLGVAPPDLERGKDAFLKPVDRTDLLGYLRDLRRRIEQYEAPPPATEEVTALRDAWTAILKPRIARMLRRIDTWTEPERWIWTPGEATPLGLVPSQWPAFVKDMAALATEFHGAWKQYGSVKLRAKETPLGPLQAVRPPSIYLGYGWPTLYGSILDRQAAARDLGAWDAYSYWHLLDRFRYAWDWSWERRRLWYESWQRRRQATEDLFQDLRAELDATRDAMGEMMLGLQVYVAALQNVEEERLLGQCTACRTEDATLREMGETALRSLSMTRLEGERYQGRSSAAYGSILRKWLRAQKAAVHVMAVADAAEPVDEGEDLPVPEPEDASSPAPPEPPADGSAAGASR